MLSLRSIRNFSLTNFDKIKFTSKSVKQRSFPKCVYIQPPIQWIKNKVNFDKLKVLDPNFDKKDFIQGSKHALLAIMNLIRINDSVELSKVTTFYGYTQITRYSKILQKDQKLKLLRFGEKDICKIIPSDVNVIETEFECECFVEFLFMGMKYLDEIIYEDKTINLKAFKSVQKLKSIPISERLLFIEGYFRLHSRYLHGTLASDWKIDFFRFSEFSIIQHKIKN